MGNTVKSRIIIISMTVIFVMMAFGSVSCCGLFGVEEETSTKTITRTETREYDREEIEYFFEIVFGSEYGGSDYTVHKWADDIRIDVKGSPTDEDMEALRLVISDLNYLIDDISLSIVNWDPDIDIYFIPQSKFYSVEPNYVTGNVGFFWAWWDGEGVLNKARILIATEGITQDERAHLIREELTQCLGMMNDSYEYPDSIFYQDWTDGDSFSEEDKAVISILYDPRIEPGMSMEEVEKVLYTNR